ncbi:hypothetical protein CJ179_38535 [Rhodococcus sp. ACS1]|nr:hypothetical protein CJ179_38535 [Rhodococcus sp. ACS1]
MYGGYSPDPDNLSVMHWDGSDLGLRYLAIGLVDEVVRDLEHSDEVCQDDPDCESAADAGMIELLRYEYIPVDLDGTMFMDAEGFRDILSGMRTDLEAGREYGYRMSFGDGSMDGYYWVTPAPAGEKCDDFRNDGECDHGCGFTTTNNKEN